MKKSKKATSVIESIVVLLVVVTGVTGMYTIFYKSTELTTSTKNKIIGIQIAKQGIEAMTNIRDTNWVKFPSDIANCWNTDIQKHSVVSTCIGDTGISRDILEGSYIIYRNNDNYWYIDSKTTGDYGVGNYINDFRVGLNNGIYTQTGVTENLRPIFTREIQISYLRDDYTIGTPNHSKIKIISKVQWLDSSSKRPHKIELEKILTNWKE